MKKGYDPMNELLRVFEFAADRTMQLSKEQSVTGDPMVFGDVTVIPVSKVSCGFAGGGADLNTSKKPDALATGVGVKVTRTPLSFLAVCEGKVQILHVAQEAVEKAGLVEAITPLVAQLKETFFNKKDAKKKTDAAK